MKIFFLAFISSALALDWNVVNPLNFTNLVDLTHPLTPDVPHVSEDEQFQLRTLVNGTQAEGHWLRVEALSTGTHVGTHLDAPCNFQESSWCVTDIPLERLVAPAVVVDIRQKVGNNGDTFLTPSDLTDWESHHGTIPKGSVLFVLTGWSRFWKDTHKYLGTDAQKNYHFPGVGKDAAEWLVKNRDIYGIGVDSFSVDYGLQHPPIVHIIMSSKKIYNLENVANLERLPPTGITLFVMPMKLEGASGAPTRLLALIRDPWEAVAEILQGIGIRRLLPKFEHFLKANADFSELLKAKKRPAKIKAIANQCLLS